MAQSPRSAEIPALIIAKAGNDNVHNRSAKLQSSRERVAVPEVSAGSLVKWQGLVDLMAEVLAVPAGLIMQVVGEDIEVAVSSRVEGNPYHVGERICLHDSGLYCETVIRTCAELHVPNALALERWRLNPDVELNMVSYLGYPLHWPDQSPFGTICVLDCKENHYSEKYKHIIQGLRDVVENDLKRDYTAWKESCTEANTRFDKLLAGLPQLVYECRMEAENHRHFTFVNARGSAEFGLDPEAAGHQLSAMLHPQDRERVLAAWADDAALQGYHLQYRLLFTDGRVRWVNDLAEPETCTEAGLLAGVLTDISSLKSTEEGLTKAELLSASGSWRWNGGEDFITFSHGLCELLQLDTDHCRCSLGDLYELFADGTGRTLHRALQQCAEDGDPFELELRSMSTTGQAHYFRALGKAIIGANGQQEGQYGSVQDVTREREQQLWMEAQNERLQLAMMVGAIAHWELALPSALFTPGLFMSHLFSTPLHERTHARHWLRLVHPVDRSALFDLLRKALGGSSFVDHQHRVVVHGKTKVVRTSAQAFQDKTLTPTRLIGTVVDVTREQEMAASLQAAEKLAAMGRLASAISHEINNPLQAVANLLYTARQAAQGQVVESILQTAEEELGRAIRHVSHSLRFHHQSESAEEVSVDQLVEAVVASFRPQLTRMDTQVQIRVGGRVSLRCYRADLEHALSNLVANAIDAVGVVNAPRLTVRVREISPGESSRFITLLIADNGPGITQAIRERLFEPFVTSKGERATGLGLWVAKGILDRHRASIRVRTGHSKACTGTVIRIAIPCTPGAL